MHLNRCINDDSADLIFGHTMVVLTRVRPDQKPEFVSTQTG
jgi:hypothetical protein